MHELQDQLNRIERDVEALRAHLDARLDHIHERQKEIMATLQDIQDDVTAEDTVIDSAVTLLQGLAAQVAALKPNQTAIDALAADIKAKSDGLAAAVAANTPAAT